MRPTPATEDWLAPFEGRLRLAGSRVLDLGCGPGLDATYLAGRGFQVAAFDRRDPGWGSEGHPDVTFLRADVRWPPFRDGAFDIAVASLSLHYLPWPETVAAFAAAADCLRPGGLFLLRVNASDDHNHGAGEGEEIEPGFFRRPPESGGWSETKRFFTEADVRAALPPGLTVEHLAHRTIHRYEQPKRVWQCLARKPEGAPPPRGYGDIVRSARSRSESPWQGPNGPCTACPVVPTESPRGTADVSPLLARAPVGRARSPKRAMGGSTADVSPLLSRPPSGQKAPKQNGPSGEGPSNLRSLDR